MKQSHETQELPLRENKNYFGSHRSGENSRVERDNAMFYDIRLVRMVVLERKCFGIDGEIGRLAGTTTRYIH